MLGRIVGVPKRGCRIMILGDARIWITETGGVCPGVNPPSLMIMMTIMIARGGLGEMIDMMTTGDTMIDMMIGGVMTVVTRSLSPLLQRNSVLWKNRTDHVS
jgi:hypothetical protein